MKNFKIVEPAEIIAYVKSVISDVTIKPSKQKKCESNKEQVHNQNALDEDKEIKEIQEKLQFQVSQVFSFSGQYKFSGHRYI